MARRVARGAPARRFAARRNAAGSRRSASTNSAAQPWMNPGSDPGLSMARTPTPSASSASTRWLPMNPFAPVTRALVGTNVLPAPADPREQAFCPPRPLSRPPPPPSRWPSISPKHRESLRTSIHCRPEYGNHPVGMPHPVNPRGSAPVAPPPPSATLPPRSLSPPFLLAPLSRPKRPTCRDPIPGPFPSTPLRVLRGSHP